MLLVRHGESEWNAQGIYQGWLESGLTSLGVSQAERVGISLREREVTAIYSSPLSRATATAEILSVGWASLPTSAPQVPSASFAREVGRDAHPTDASPPIVVDDDLREIHHGQWSGRTMADVDREWPDLSATWTNQPAAASMPGGETLADVRVRSLRFLDRIRHGHADGQLVVVTHGTVIRLLLTHFLNMELNRVWTFDVENGGVSIVEDHETPLIMAINDACHLDGVRSRLDVQVR